MRFAHLALLVLVTVAITVAVIGCNQKQSPPETHTPKLAMKADIEIPQDNLPPKAAQKTIVDAFVLPPSDDPELAGRVGVLNGDDTIWLLPHQFSDRAKGKRAATFLERPRAPTPVLEQAVVDEPRPEHSVLKKTSTRQRQITGTCRQNRILNLRVGGFGI